MRITIESLNKDEYYHKVTLEDNAEHIEEVIELFKKALLAYGFHPETIEKFLETEQ